MIRSRLFSVTPAATASSRRQVLRLFSFSTPAASRLVASYRACASPTSSLLQSELLRLFSPNSNNGRFVVSELASKLSDDALDELDRSLKDWIAQHMRGQLAVVAGADGKFYVERVVAGNAPSAAASAVRKSARVDGASISLEDVMAAPPPPAVPIAVQDPKRIAQDVLKAARREQQQREDAAERAHRAAQREREAREAVNLSATDVDVLNANIRAPNTSDPAAQSRQQQQQVPRKMQPLPSQAAQRFTLPQRLALCFPSFVVPLCHETLSLLEARMASHGGDDAVKAFLTGEHYKAQVLDRLSEITPLQRLRILMGGGNKNNGAGMSSSFPASVDATMVDIVRIESFAPTRADVVRWRAEDPTASRVDALAPQKMVGLQQQQVEQDRAGAAAAAVGGAASDAAVNASAALAVAPEDFEPPAWIVEHDEGDGAKRFRYFFSLSAVHAAEKHEFSLLLFRDEHIRRCLDAGELRPNMPANPDAASATAVLPLGDDDADFGPFHAQEYDAFRLARCLPANAGTITLKQLVVGGVLNVLSVPDVQFILTAFPEMFEFPCRVVTSSGTATAATTATAESSSSSPADLSVRFILAGDYDSAPVRSPDLIRSEMSSLEDAIRTRIMPGTQIKMKGGAYMRMRNRYQTLKKELTAALHPGPHPFKDSRVLAQLLFDLLPTDDCVPLEHIHHKLKFTEVQLGDSLNEKFFRRHPHLFRVVHVGSSDRVAIIRADAPPELLSLYDRKPATEEVMLRDLFETFRKVRARLKATSKEYGGVVRDSVPIGHVIVKLHPSSRYAIEDMFPSKAAAAAAAQGDAPRPPKMGELGVRVVQHYSDCFTMLPPVPGSTEQFVLLLDDAPRVKKFSTTPL